APDSHRRPHLRLERGDETWSLPKHQVAVIEIFFCNFDRVRVGRSLNFIGGLCDAMVRVQEVCSVVKHGDLLPSFISYARPGRRDKLNVAQRRWTTGKTPLQPPGIRGATKAKLPLAKRETA